MAWDAEFRHCRARREQMTAEFPSGVVGSRDPGRISTGIFLTTSRDLSVEQTLNRPTETATRQAGLFSNQSRS